MKRIITLLLVGIMCISIISCGKMKPAEIGETTEYGDKEITVNYIEFADYICNDEKSDKFLMPCSSEYNSWLATHDRIWITISFTAKNIGNSWTVIDDEGTIYYKNGDNEYRFNTDCILYSRMGTNTWKNWYGKLEPLSDSVEFRVYFAVPRELRENDNGSVKYQLYGHEYTVK